MFDYAQCHICKKHGHTTAYCYFRYTQFKNNGISNQNNQQSRESAPQAHLSHTQNQFSVDNFDTITTYP